MWTTVGGPCGKCRPCALSLYTRDAAIGGVASRPCVCVFMVPGMPTPAAALHTVAVRPSMLKVARAVPVQTTVLIWILCVVPPVTITGVGEVPGAPVEPATKNVTASLFVSPLRTTLTPSVLNGRLVVLGTAFVLALNSTVFPVAIAGIWKSTFSV